MCIWVVEWQKQSKVPGEKTFDSNSVSLILVGSDEPFIYSHPKLQKLEEVVLQHFRLWAESSADKNGEVTLEDEIWLIYAAVKLHM